MKKFFKKDEEIKETNTTEPNEDGTGENPDAPADEEKPAKKKNLKKAFIIGGAAMAGLTIIGGIIKERFFSSAEPEEEYEDDGDPDEDSEDDGLDDSESEEESEEE